MKIIDLLNKIANGEEVPHFLIDEQEYYLGADGYLKEVFGDDVEWTLDYEWLNQEVEIIEEEQDIKELDMFEEAYCDSAFDGIVFKKINQLITEVNKLKNK